METGTLKLMEDDRGLGFVIHAGPTTAAKDAAVVVGRNRVGMSFAFICGRQDWTTLPDGSRLRTISEFKDLDDISIVVDAAYKSSDVTVAKRSLEEALAIEKRTAAEAATQKVETEKRAAADAAAQTKKQREIEDMEKRPSVDYLKRQLDLADLEARCYGNYPERRDEEQPKHGPDAAEAHRATRETLRAKENSGLPSRALELKAAAAHQKAAESAKTEGKTAAADFHTKAAAMHDAAASDQYAANFSDAMQMRGRGLSQLSFDESGTVPFGLETRTNQGDAMSLTEQIEARFNPNHDDKGRFDSAEGASKAAEKATKSAEKASKHAAGSKSASAHDRAADAHEAAHDAHKVAEAHHKALAAYHKGAGHADKAKEHLAAAKMHAAKAEAHQAAEEGRAFPRNPYVEQAEYADPAGAGTGTAAAGEAAATA
jgi:hypothetical protein